MKQTSHPHGEKHQSGRAGWLRAAVLGSDDGIVSRAPVARASLRVTLGGALAMAVTAAIGLLLGTSVG